MIDFSSTAASPLMATARAACISDRRRKDVLDSRVVGFHTGPARGIVATAGRPLRDMQRCLLRQISVIRLEKTHVNRYVARQEPVAIADGKLEVISVSKT